MVGIGEDLKPGVEAGDSTAILRRRGTLAADIAWVARSVLGSTGPGQGKQVLPAVAEIVDVGEFCFAWPQQLVQAQLGGAAGPDARAGDLELPEMAVLPVHGGLDDGMQLLERHRGRHLDLAPDRRIRVEKI